MMMTPPPPLCVVSMHRELGRLSVTGAPAAEGRRQGAALGDAAGVLTRAPPLP